ncbi:MAG: DMT family transporter [Acidobacteria bacterium]|nr:DMT family transporter [Acidobacteriota bacterium]
MTTQTLIDLIVLGALWGASFLFLRVAAPAFGPVPLIFVRVTIAAVLLLPPMLRHQGFAQVRAVAAPIALVGAINTAIPFTLLAFAALTLPAGLSSVLNASVPLFGGLIGFLWLGQRPTRQRALGLAVGFGGVLVLAWPRLTSASDWRAVVAALVATVLYALAAHVTQRSLKGVRPLVVAGGSMAAASLMLLPLAVVAWPAAPPAASAWGYAALLGVGCTALAYLLYFRLLARSGPSTAMAVTYLIPVFGVTWGALLLDERLPSSAIAGALLVLAGVALATWTPARRAALR